MQRRSHPFAALEKGLHLPDIGGFAIQKLLAQDIYLLIISVELVLVFYALDHPSGVSLDHHSGNLGVSIAVRQLCPCHHIGHEPHCRIQFWQLPTPLGGYAVGIGFDGIVFPELGFQRFAQSRPHAGIQNAANTDLTHLGGFQDRTKHFFAVFHIHHR